MSSTAQNRHLDRRFNVQKIINTQEVNSITFMMHRFKTKAQVLVIKTNGIIGEREKRDVMGTDEDGPTSNENMNPKQRLLEVEREQGANRKSFQAAQHLSLEKKRKVDIFRMRHTAAEVHEILFSLPRNKIV